VADGYHFGADYQRIIKESGVSLLFVDDNGHAGQYYADFVLNQNLHADEALYRQRQPYTRLLLGPRFALLRREFLQWRGWKRQVPKVACKVLVTLGGSDPCNATLKVIEALRTVEVSGLEAVVVVGASNPHLAALESAVRQSPVPIRLERQVSDMGKLMAWADVAVSGSGSTCWELVFMQLPILAFVLADNQTFVAQALAQEGALINLASPERLSSRQISESLSQLLVSSERRAPALEKLRAQVDGDGVSRVVMHLRGDPLRLRRALAGDCQLLWKWANDRSVRQAAFSPEPIPWEQHVEWFSRKLQDPKSLIFLALDAGDCPLGQIRFDFKERQEAEIDVSVDACRRGCGYGAVLISLGTETLFRTTAVQAVHAVVKAENVSSIRAFEKAGFRDREAVTVAGTPSIHLVRSKSHD